MIRSFADETTEDIWHGKNSKAARRIPQKIWHVVRRKLDLIDGVSRVDALRVPPGNRLETYKKGYSIRVNDQFRITFTFAEGHAYKVCYEDYH